MRADEERRFSRALTNFLEQECVTGADLSIADEQLFHRFTTFWIQAPERFDHPSLLGQFRVELAQRGFRSFSEGKHPLWVGLTLKKNKKKSQEKG